MILQAHMRPANALSSRERPTPMTCQVHGCTIRPKEGKDYCVDHIGLRPYVRALLVELEARESEVNVASSGTWRNVNPRGPIAQWILAHADKTGGASIEKIAKDIAIPVLVVTRCAAALVRAGLATSRLGGRKSKNRTKKKKFLVPVQTTRKTRATEAA